MNQGIDKTLYDILFQLNTKSIIFLSDHNWTFDPPIKIFCRERKETVVAYIAHKVPKRKFAEY